MHLPSPPKSNLHHQNGTIRLLPLPLEWDSLAVAQALPEEMDGAPGAGIDSPVGVAFMQVCLVVTRKLDHADPSRLHFF